MLGDIELLIFYFGFFESQAIKMVFKTILINAVTDFSAINQSKILTGDDLFNSILEMRFCHAFKEMDQNRIENTMLALEIMACLMSCLDLSPIRQEKIMKLMDELIAYLPLLGVSDDCFMKIVTHPAFNYFTDNRNEVMVLSFLRRYPKLPEAIMNAFIHQAAGRMSPLVANYVNVFQPSDSRAPLVYQHDDQMEVFFKNMRYSLEMQVDVLQRGLAVKPSPYTIGLSSLKVQRKNFDCVLLLKKLTGLYECFKDCKDYNSGEITSHLLACIIEMNPEKIEELFSCIIKNPALRLFDAHSFPAAECLVRLIDKLTDSQKIKTVIYCLNGRSIEDDFYNEMIFSSIIFWKNPNMKSNESLVMQQDNLKLLGELFPLSDSLREILLKEKEEIQNAIDKRQGGLLTNGLFKSEAHSSSDEPSVVIPAKNVMSR